MADQVEVRLGKASRAKISLHSPSPARERLLLFREMRSWVLLGSMQRGGYGAVGYLRDMIAWYDV